MLPRDALWVLGAWLGLGLGFVGLGRLVLRALGSAATGPEGWLLAFWLGWVSALFALQVSHLALPVDGRATAALELVGLVGLAVGARRPHVRDVLARALPLAALALAAVWLSDRALDGPHHGDAGAYFLPTVRWLVEYPIVRGLANLFVPFAFNQSYFLYVAMLDVGPFGHRSYHLANGLLVLALVARALLGLYRLLRRDRPCAPADIFYALVLPVALSAGEGIFLTSPSPDLPVFVLGIVVSGELIALVSRPAGDRDPRVVALLTTGGVTVKLSFAGLAAAILPIAVIAAVIRHRSGVAGAFRSIAAVGVVVSLGAVPWVIRNIILSGRPFYPSAFGALPVPWRTEADALEWVKAPMHFGAYPWEFFRDPRWFITRLDSLGWISPGVLVPSSITLGALVIGTVLVVVRWLRRRPATTRRVSAIILVPPIASLVFVGATAPMAHYTGATFWLLALQSVLLVIDGPAGRVGSLCRVLVAVVVLVASGQALSRQPLSVWSFREFQPLPAAVLTQTRLESGLVVGVPQYGQCWNAPLPCTPSPNPALRLRRDGDLGSGFVLDHAIAAKPPAS
jgi:hypothetical protein